MKLIFCPKCNDVIRLYQKDIVRKCQCNRSWGRYTDGLHAIYGGDAIPLGFSNPSFTCALENQPKEEGSGKLFEAFVIPEKCKTFIKEIKNHEHTKKHQETQNEA